MRTKTGLNITYKGNRVIVKTDDELRDDQIKREQFWFLVKTISIFLIGVIQGILIAVLWK